MLYKRYSVFLSFISCERDSGTPNIVWLIAEDFSPELVINFNNVLKEWQTETNDSFDDPDRNDLEKMIAGKRNGLKEWYLSNGLSENPSNKEVLDYWRFIKNK